MTKNSKHPTKILRSDTDGSSDNVSDSAASGSLASFAAGEHLGRKFPSSDLLGAFAIDPATGVVTIANGSLLDFETGRKFLLWAET